MSLETFIFRTRLPLTELPDKRMQFTLGMYGDGDFFTMKGVVEEFLEKVGITCRKTYSPESGKPFLHPGRQADIYCGETLVGYSRRSTSDRSSYVRYW